MTSVLAIVVKVRGCGLTWAGARLMTPLLVAVLNLSNVLYVCV